MRILLIEDDDIKANRIIHDLNALGETSITRFNARNPGLKAWSNARNTIEAFDLIITDDIMPIYSDSHDLTHCAENIVTHIRRRNDETPICICSSNDFDLTTIDANYAIKYDAAVYLQNLLETMIVDAKAYNVIRKQS